ncbi:hypothetical protein GGR56DRAFT_589201 [Xylariaceae sp. FL0804]|nr:hypothetical protein GGR56DRAFT_589201 [Xylariaceae sp. FL0804]
MSPSTDDLRSVMEDTLRTFLDCFESAVRNHDVSLLSAVLSPECTRHLKPASFLAAYPFIKAVETNSEYETRMVHEIGAMEEARANVLELVIDTAKRRGSAHAEHTTRMPGQPPLTIEMSWYVDFTADGEKITRIVEFIDSVVSSKMLDDFMKQAPSMFGNQGAAA